MPQAGSIDFVPRGTLAAKLLHDAGAQLRWCARDCSGLNALSSEHAGRLPPKTAGARRLEGDEPDSSSSVSIEADGTNRHEIRPAGVRRRQLLKARCSPPRFPAVSTPGRLREEMPPFASSTRRASDDSDGRTIFSGMAGDPPPEPRSNQVPGTSGMSFGSQQRLDEQPVERRVRRSVQGQGSEVDLDVPLRQQAIVRLEGCEHLLGDDDASLASASRQALPEFARRHAASLQPIRRQASDVRAQHRNGGRRHARGSAAPVRACPAGSGQPLNRFCRQARHAVKREARGDPALFVPERSGDIALLSSEITSVFYNSFH